MDMTEYKQIMATDYGCYDNTQDARFESMRNYPRRVQLYRKHKDLLKEYEHKVQYYKRCQRMFSLETKLKKQKVEGRFVRLVKTTRSARLPAIAAGCLKFNSNNNVPSGHTKRSSRLGTILPEIDESLNGSPHGSRAPSQLQQRLPSRRSISVDNVLHNSLSEQPLFRAVRQNGRVTYRERNLNGDGAELQGARSMTSLPVIDM